MKVVLFEWVLILLTITRAEALGKLWKLNFSGNERTVKRILESCYENEILSGPVVIFGDSNEVIDGLSVIRMNKFLEVTEVYGENQLSQPKASRIVLIPDSQKKLESDLQLLKETEWWNHMAPFFIIVKSETTCTDFKGILNITWRMDILNSIYICTESMNVTELYTLNPIANYAPHPWRRVEKLKEKDLNVFHQVFDENVSCKNLNFDKTKILNGYEIRAVEEMEPGRGWVVGENYFEDAVDFQGPDARILRFIIRTLNASGKFEVEFGRHSLMGRFDNRTSDMMIFTYTLASFHKMSFLFPHQWTQMVAVISSSPEMSTLRKILHLWSKQVLIAAVVSLIVLCLILTVKNRNLFLAMLDVLRLLTYTSIHTDARNQAFRIYFTTMLILMVVSNTIFQGEIVAFLTKQEKISGIATIEELVKLRYQMYTSGSKELVEERCPKCDFIEVSRTNCIKFVLNSTSHVCGISKHEYEANYVLLSLETVTEMLSERFESYKCRHDWPLQNRVNDAIMRLVESGIMDFLRMRDTDVPKAKRRAMEAEWSQYKPLKLYKLKFAFQVLVYGLSFATIVFFLEIWWANYEAP